MDARDEIKRGLLLLAQIAAESNSDTIKKDIDLLTGVTLQLTAELANRNAALGKQCRSRKSNPPKSAPARGPQKPKQPQSSTDTPNTQNGAEDRSKALSSMQQGIRQADPSLADQQRALRGQIYGAHNDDVQFRKAAKAIAR